MVTFGISIKTEFGNISVESNSVEELASSIPEGTQIESITTRVHQLGVVHTEPREPKPGFERIYRFTRNGLVELIMPPENPVDTVALVMFAYDPEAATTDQITRSSGVVDISRRYLSHPTYKGYFVSFAEGKYNLTQEGKPWASGRVREWMQQIAAETGEA